MPIGALSRFLLGWLVLALASSSLVLGCSDDAMSAGDAAVDHDHDHDPDHGHDEDGGEVAIGTPSGAVCPSGSTLTWDNFGEEFMTTYCTRCHSRELKGAAHMGAPADHDFDWHEGVLFVKEHVDQYAAAGPSSVNTVMPFNGDKPTLAERRQLGEWLACGVR